MPLPPDDIRAKLAQLRNEFAMRAALQSEYDKEMSGKYIHEMIPFADWLAQRNAPTGKAKGGLAGFLEPSVEKGVMYHGTRRNIKKFKPREVQAYGGPDAIYLSSVPNVANKFAERKKENKLFGEPLRVGEKVARGANVMPLHVQVTNPFDISNEEHLKNIKRYFDENPEQLEAYPPEHKEFLQRERAKVLQSGAELSHNRAKNKEDNFTWLELPSVQNAIRKMGHDAFYLNEMGAKTMGVYDPRKIKSAIGNRGTYDTTNPDITKASGGSVPSLDVMRLAIGGQGPRNFLKGTVEKVIEPLKKYDLPDLFPEFGEPPPNSDANKAVNLWIERNLANYIRKQMGHPNDPVRKLAEEGILHFDPESLGIEEEQAEGRRQMLGGQKLAKGPLAQAWENAVDYQFEPNTVEDIKAMPDIYKGAYEPWMDKVDPKTTLYELYEADRLGFDHIVDILKEDLAQGRIRPEQLSKVSIEQAVRRTHQYDQERKKVMAETALKSTEGMPVHKDYGDGFKWIELTLPKDLPEGWTVKSLPSGGETYYDPQGVRHVQPNMGKLKDALKYEGDTMGHCVGGYCPDVAEGRSRIFSLRDAKNEPHVTVEVKPHHILTWDDVSMAVGPSKASELWNEFNESGGYEKNAEQEFDAFVRKKGIKGPERIAQIKGKGNSKPKQDYIPYVQDFVKSGNWSDVDELRNADMHYAGNLYTNDERKNLERLTGEKMDYVAHQDIPRHRELLKQHNVPPLLPDNKAGGGEVDAEAVFMGKGGKVKELEQYLRQREGEYGVKRLQRAADEIPGLENMYDYEALRSAFGGDNAQALMTMNPADFEKFAHRLGSEEDESAYEGGMTREQYLNKLIRIARAKGFRDVPFLDVGKRKPTYLPSIEGHEGRHRTRALAKMGEQKTLVRLFPTPSMREPMPRRYREDFIEAMKKELGEKRLVTPEGRSLLPADLTAQEHRNLENRNLVASNRPQLPEIYKDGGDVDPESVFFPKSKE